MTKYFRHIAASLHRAFSRVCFAITFRLRQPPSSTRLAQTQATKKGNAVRIAVIVLIALLAVPLFRIAMFALPQDAKTLLSNASPDLKLIVSSHQYASPGEEETLLVTAVNTGTVPLNDLVARVVYTGTAPLGVGLDASNTLSFGTLEPGERKTKSIKLNPLLKMSEQSGRYEPITDTLRIAVWNRVDSQPIDESPSYSLNVVALPFMRRVFGGLSALVAALLAPALKLMWDVAFGDIKPATSP